MLVQSIISSLFVNVKSDGCHMERQVNMGECSFAKRKVPYKFSWWTFCAESADEN
jgi:hypothetical protein